MTFFNKNDKVNKSSYDHFDGISLTVKYFAWNFLSIVKYRQIRSLHFSIKCQSKQIQIRSIDLLGIFCQL